VFFDNCHLAPFGAYIMLLFELPIALFSVIFIAPRLLFVRSGAGQFFFVVLLLGALDNYLQRR